MVQVQSQAWRAHRQVAACGKAHGAARHSPQKLVHQVAHAARSRRRRRDHPPGGSSASCGGQPPQLLREALAAAPANSPALGNARTVRASRKRQQRGRRRQQAVFELALKKRVALQRLPGRAAFHASQQRLCGGAPPVGRPRVAPRRRRSEQLARLTVVPVPCTRSGSPPSSSAAVRDDCSRSRRRGKLPPAIAGTSSAARPAAAAPRRPHAHSAAAQSPPRSCSGGAAQRVALDGTRHAAAAAASSEKAPAQARSSSVSHRSCSTSVASSSVERGDQQARGARSSSRPGCGSCACRRSRRPQPAVSTGSGLSQREEVVQRDRLSSSITSLAVVEQAGGRARPAASQPVASGSRRRPAAKRSGHSASLWPASPATRPSSKTGRLLQAGWRLVGAASARAGRGWSAKRLR